MININETLRKALEKKEDTSISFASKSDQPITKITIEIPGQDPVVLDNLNDFMVFSRSNDRTGCIGMAGLAFLLWVFQEVKQKISELAKINLQEIFGKD